MIFMKVIVPLISKAASKSMTEVRLQYWSIQEKKTALRDDGATDLGNLLLSDGLV
jgi:hypothetical protein